MADVLVLEPHPEIRELLVRLLVRLGYTPIDKNDLPERKPDIVVLEPAAIGGIKIVQNLREQNPALPLVCVSIYPLEPWVEALLPTAHLLKPFTLSQLGEAMALASESPPLLHFTHNNTHPDS